MGLFKISEKIDNWIDSRGITANGTPLGQASKTLEEVAELVSAISAKDIEEMADAIGDIYVTLRAVCKVSDLNFESCVARAWEEIKDRKGYLRADGVFVKEEV